MEKNEINEFEGKILCKRFNTIIKICATASPELNLFIEKDKILIQAKHSSNSKLIEAIIKSEAFESYKCKKGFLIKIDTINILKFLSYAKLPNTILNIKTDGNQIFLEHGKYKLINSLIDSSLETKFTLPDERTEKDDRPPLKFGYEIELNASEFTDKVKSSNSIYEVTTFKLDKKVLEITTKNELGEFTAIIDNINYKKFTNTCISKFSAPDIIQFVEKVKDKILFKSGDKLPLKIEKQLFPFADIKFLLAPMVDINE